MRLAVKNARKLPSLPCFYPRLSLPNPRVNIDPISFSSFGYSRSLSLKRKRRRKKSRCPRRRGRPRGGRRPRRRPRRRCRWLLLRLY
nr:hypothetical protein HmN_001011900 [Hymenolepis microstoma]